MILESLDESRNRLQKDKMKPSLIWKALILLSLGGCNSLSNQEPASFVIAKKEVLEHLLAPATAKFSAVGDPDSGSTLSGTGIWHSWGTVDSQNPFGSLIRGKWETYGSDRVVIYWRVGDTDSGILSLRAAKEIMVPHSTGNVRSEMVNVDDQIRLLKEGYEMEKAEQSYCSANPDDTFAKNALSELDNQIRLVEQVPGPP